MSGNRFAEFLVARRAELRPADVGLPGAGRRRTPGLRREEVAVRAGVSVDYLARLEQGRDMNPSIAVVDALADALLLDDAQRRHIGLLALTAGREERCPGAGTAARVVPESVEAIVRALDPTPAFVLGRGLTVRTGNRAWTEFAEPLGLLDHPGDLAYWVFRHEAARRVLHNRAAVAESFTAMLYRASTRWPTDRELREIIDDLRRIPEFAQRWQPRLAAEPAPTPLRLEHPVHGAVTITTELLETQRDHTVVVWLPDRELARGQGLRLVRGDRAANE
ncbi:helix-turn-helix domain-containing protein [Nocardia asteroides]|uniref:helix-turn-helix domain-containing protein n=1 Tax=Nocardia asteroides TaxID=1824 RepID=UPI001E53A621|nr:helix-turn-helix domain-containing protein [Nocardia asteroides]UGT64077.1 helix-turn-helix transcriptional regulator [Nocardia asteroides]